LLEFRAQEGRDPDIDHVDTDADKLKATAVEVLKSLGVDQDWLDLSFTEYALLHFSVKVCIQFPPAVTCSQCNDPFFKICDIQYTDMSMTVHPVFSRIFPYFMVLYWRIPYIYLS